MPKQQTSLHKKLVLRFGLVYLSTFLVIFTVIVVKNTLDFNTASQQVENRARKALINKGLVLAENNGNALVGMVEDNAFTSVQELVNKTIESDLDILYGIFVDLENNPWVRVIPAELSEKYSLAIENNGQWALGLSGVDYNSIFFDSLEVIEVAVPVKVDGENAGVLRYGISTHSLLEIIESAQQTAVNSLYATVFWLSLVMLFIGAIAYQVVRKMARKITIPLNHLADAAEVIAAGKYDKKIEVRTNDEVGQLAVNFNIMVANINRQIGDLAKINELGKLLARQRKESQALSLVIQGILQQLHMALGVHLECVGKKLSVLSSELNNQVEFKARSAPRVEALCDWLNRDYLSTGYLAVDDVQLITINLAENPHLEPFDSVLWVPLNADGGAGAKQTKVKNAKSIEAPCQQAFVFWGSSKHAALEQSEIEFCLSVVQLLSTSLKNITMNQLLAEHNRTLEQKVAQRTQLLEVKNEALGQAMEGLKQAQEQLVESEKMASLGSLVAGISHEVNTPLGISVTAASLLKETTEDFEKLFKAEQLTKKSLAAYLETSSESSDIILNNLKRAANLVKSFKQIAVDQTADIEVEFNVKEHLNMLLTSLSPSYKHEPITIESEINENLTITSYPGLLNQVVSNLIMNSIKHGIDGPGGGVVKVSADAVDNDRIELLVEDNGSGIPDEHKAKVFEPFFTTKRGGGGSGLGLNIVYNLVTQKMQGEIRLEDVSSGGSRFIITIPKKLKPAVINAMAG